MAKIPFVDSNNPYWLDIYRGYIFWGKSIKNSTFWPPEMKEK